MIKKIIKNNWEIRTRVNVILVIYQDILFIKVTTQIVNEKNIYIVSNKLRIKRKDVQ